MLFMNESFIRVPTVRQNRQKCLLLKVTIAGPAKVRHYRNFVHIRQKSLLYSVSMTFLRSHFCFAKFQVRTPRKLGTEMTNLIATRRANTGFISETPGNIYVAQSVPLPYGRNSCLPFPLLKNFDP